MLFLLMGICTSACHSQIDASSSYSLSSTLKPAPTIVGTPPPYYSSPPIDSGLVSQYIRCIFQDSRGHYWFGPAGQSVARYDGDTLRYFSKDEFFLGNERIETEWGNSVHAIAEDKAGNIWFGTFDGVVRYDGTSFKSYLEKDGLANIQVGRQSMLVDRSGQVWVGTRAGVFQYDPASEAIGGPGFKRFDKFPPIHARHIFEDRDGRLWFASATQGIFRYDGAEVMNLTEKDGLGDTYAGGIAQDPDGHMWFTMKNGICRYDGKSFTTYTKSDGLGGTEIWGLLIETSGIIWITARGSTTRFDPSLPASDPGTFRVFTPADGLNCCVQSMYQDRAGHVWWGAGQGLYRFDGNNFYQVKQAGPW